MKNTPAVFLTSLVVSAISLTTPLPAASTILHLFIGEDLAVYDMAETDCDVSRQRILEVKDETGRHNTSSGCEKSRLLRKMAEEPNYSGDNYEAASRSLVNLPFIM